MKKYQISTYAAVLCGLTLASINSLASTKLATTTHGGHTYELWGTADGGLDISWQDAKAEALAAGGYLATLTDAAETTAVFGAFDSSGFLTAPNGDPYQAWLGGYTTDPSLATSDPLAWAWVTGEPWTAFDAGNFVPGEPNGDAASDLAINRHGTAFWNDEGGNVARYIVEKNVPDAGSSLLLLGGSVLVLGMVGRKLLR